MVPTSNMCFFRSWAAAGLWPQRRTQDPAVHSGWSRTLRASTPSVAHRFQICCSLICRRRRCHADRREHPTTETQRHRWTKRHQLVVPLSLLQPSVLHMTNTEPLGTRSVLTSSGFTTHKHRTFCINNSTNRLKKFYWTPSVCVELNSPNSTRTFWMLHQSPTGEQWRRLNPTEFNLKSNLNKISSTMSQSTELRHLLDNKTAERFSKMNNSFHLQKTPRNGVPASSNLSVQVTGSSFTWGISTNPLIPWCHFLFWLQSHDCDRETCQSSSSPVNHAAPPQSDVCGVMWFKRENIWSNWLKDERTTRRIQTHTHTHTRLMLQWCWPWLISCYSNSSV